MSKAKTCKLVAKAKGSVKRALARVLVRPYRTSGKRPRIVPGVVRFAGGQVVEVRIYRFDRCRYAFRHDDHFELTDEDTGEQTYLTLHGCDCEDDQADEGKRCHHILAFRQLRAAGEL